VATLFGNPNFVPSGYSLAVCGLQGGSYQLVVYAHSALTGFWYPANRAVQVVPHRGAIAVDAPQPGTARQPFAVSGWAIDRCARADTTGVNAVHAYAFPTDASGALTGAPPIFLGAAAYGGHRPDVGALFGGQFTNSGFGLSATGLPAGSYLLVVYARSTVSGHWQNAARLIHVP